MSEKNLKDVFIGIVVSGGEDKELNFWNFPACGQMVKKKHKIGSMIHCLQHDDQNGVFVGCNDGNISKFSFEPKSSLTSRSLKWTGHKAQMNTLDFCENRKTLISGSDDATVRVWTNFNNCEGEPQSHSFTVGEDGVYSVKFVGSDLIASAGWQDLIFHDLGKMTLSNEYKEYHSHWIYCLCYDEKKNILFSVSSDKMLKLFDPTSGKLVKKINCKIKLGSLSYLSHLGEIVVGEFCGKCQLHVYDIRTYSLKKTFVAHEKHIYGIEPLSNGNFLCSCSNDSSVKIWNPEQDYKLMNTMKRENSYRGVEAITELSQHRFEKREKEAAEDLKERMEYLTECLMKKFDGSEENELFTLMSNISLSGGKKLWMIKLC